MNRTETKVRNIAVALAIFVMGMMGLFALAPSEADIQACVDNSNYSYETCKHELSQ